MCSCWWRRITTTAALAAVCTTCAYRSFVSLIDILNNDSIFDQVTQNGSETAPSLDGYVKKNVALGTGSNRSTGESDTNACPLVFGLGHQKSGTSTIVKALGSIAQTTAKSDVPGFWRATPMSDKHVLLNINPEAGLIQKDAFGIYYLRQLARLCPSMRYYVVRRDSLTTVRSVADRLGIDANSNCKTVDWIRPAAWQTVFLLSNSTSCLVRIAASVIEYKKRVRAFSKDHDVTEISYENYLKDRVESIRSMCQSLEVLGPCNGTKLDNRQYQSVGKNRGKNLSDIWPASVFEELVEMFV